MRASYIEEQWLLAEMTSAPQKTYFPKPPHKIDPSDIGQLKQFVRSAPQLPTKRYVDAHTLTPEEIALAIIEKYATLYAQQSLDLGYIEGVDAYRQCRKEFIDAAYSFLGNFFSLIQEEVCCARS